MNPHSTLRLYFPADRETALNLLRSKLRYDLVRRYDASGNFTCFTDREAAQRRAHELQRLKSEMFLVVIELEADRQRIEVLISQSQSRDAMISHEDKFTLTFNADAQNTLSCEARFSLEIVPGTEDWLATYGNRAPECGVGCGPYSA